MLLESAILEEIDNGLILIQPFVRENLGPNSYDVRLSKHLAEYEDPILDCKKDNPARVFEIPEEGFTLLPGKFYLGTTVEYTETHPPLIPMFEGRSSVGRLGIAPHEAAGFGDSGFEGHWTLELSARQPVIIYPNMKIGQLAWHRGEGTCTPYSKKGNYCNSSDKPISSKLFSDGNWK